MCPHNKRKARCQECGGSQFCEVLHVGAHVLVRVHVCMCVCRQPCVIGFLHVCVGVHFVHMISRLCVCVCVFVWACATVRACVCVFLYVFE
jgi:hypothetical protein